MQHNQAVEMLSHNDWKQSEKQIWTDLGSGTGTFTLALANLLHSGSRIISVDKDQNALDQIPDQYNQVTIQKIAANFLDEDFSPCNLDGILMANSLHFVQNQSAFINKARQWLKPRGHFLIVEYDTDSPNPWIPHPVSFNRLNNLFGRSGFSSIQKLNEKPSRYNRSNLYSALIQYRDSNKY